MTRYLHRLFAILPLTLMPLHAQDAYQDWLEKQQAGFQEYQEQQDQQFSAFLKAEWEKLNAFKGIVPDETPKPVKIPVYKPPKEKDQPKPPPVTNPVAAPDIPKPKPAPKPAQLEMPRAAKVKHSRALTIKFLGMRLGFEIDGEMARRPQGSIGKQFVSDYWEQITRTDYLSTLRQAMHVRQQLDLNDWGYGLLLKRIGEAMYGNEEHLVDLFTWFMLLKSGYDAKVGYTSDRILLLLPSGDQIYSIPFFRFEGSQQKYYTIAFGEAPGGRHASVYIYKGDYAAAQTLMDFSVRTVPALNTAHETRVRTFTYKGTPYRVPTVVNKDIVELYRYYPLTPMAVFFNAAVSPSVNYRLLSSMGKLIDGKSEAEAVNMLLRFVQTAFEYQTDDQQFGREKYLIPDETLYYGSCDCEDRSILFAHLVRELVGLPVVGLDYPGHIATAVQFSQRLPGAHVGYRGEQYLICDPTYINADIGMVMPQFKDTPPVLIGLP